MASIESIDNQIEIVSKEIAKYAWQDSQGCKDPSKYNWNRHIFCNADINRDS